MLLRGREILAVVVERAEVDMRGSVLRLKFDYPKIDGDGFIVGVGMLLQRHSAGEQIGSRVDAHDWSDFGRNHRAHRLKLHHKLASYRFDGVSFMTERDPVTYAEHAGFQERVFHAGNLLTHRHQRLANHSGTHALGAQITNLFELNQVEEREVF